MELIGKTEPIIFKWYDITFRVRSYMTGADNFALVCNRNSMKNGMVAYDPENYFITVIRLFIEAWEGVTEKNSPVPFSMERLLLIPDQKPADGMYGNLVMDLGKFINANVIEKSLKVTEEIKKKSPIALGGSSQTQTLTNANPQPVDDVKSTDIPNAKK